MTNFYELLSFQSIKCHDWPTVTTTQMQEYPIYNFWKSKTFLCLQLKWDISLVWVVNTHSASPPARAPQQHFLPLRNTSRSVFVPPAGIHGGCEVSRAVHLLGLGVCPGLSGSASLPGAGGDPDRWKRSAPLVLCADCCAGLNIIFTASLCWASLRSSFDSCRWNLPLTDISSVPSSGVTLGVRKVSGSGAN